MHYVSAEARVQNAFINSTLFLAPKTTHTFELLFFSFKLHYSRKKQFNRWYLFQSVNIARTSANKQTIKCIAPTTDIHKRSPDFYKLKKQKRPAGQANFCLICVGSNSFSVKLNEQLSLNWWLIHFQNKIKSTRQPATSGVVLTVVRPLQIFPPASCKQSRSFVLGAGLPFGRDQARTYQFWHRFHTTYSTSGIYECGGS